MLKDLNVAAQVHIKRCVDATKFLIPVARIMSQVVVQVHHGYLAKLDCIRTIGTITIEPRSDPIQRFTHVGGRWRGLIQSKINSNPVGKRVSGLNSEMVKVEITL